MRYIKTLTVLLLASFIFSGFWSGKDKSELIKERQTIAKTTLQDLYKYDPASKNMVAKSYGYAVFSNMGVNLLVLSTERGTGLAHDNKTGKDIYMNMVSVGGGFGLGVKDFRAVFIFSNKKVFDEFVNKGWEANAQADAAAKYDKDGAATNNAITVAPGIRLYKLTKNGLALQATIQGTKYWKDEDLN